jgi:O-antigen chain-terminating methyltransferase
MRNNFYRAFQEKHRGSRELIKSRLQVYLPFVQPLLKAYPAGRALDVGCGRGEWLELMGVQGFDALGVDLDDAMLQACRERNLKVETADAVAYMQGLPESSICVVSGFHIAEHLPFEVLQQLVKQTLRVLVPGGLLILETPNPENIAVGTSSFYLDPTHQRPIPPELLSFLPEHYGFARFKVMRLQESAHLLSDAQVSLLDVLNGVSPDYAVVSQKQGVPLLMEALAPAFDQSHGLTLHDLAKRHEQAIDKRLIATEAKAQQAQQQMQQVFEKAAQAEASASSHLQTIQSLKTELAEVRQELNIIHHANNNHWLQLQERYKKLTALFANKSWHITMPLRWGLGQARRLKAEGLASRFKALVKKVLRKFDHYLVTHSALRQKLLRWSHRLGIYATLKKWREQLRDRHVLIPYAVYAQQQADKNMDLTQLKPGARKIYEDLLRGIESKKGGAINANRD